MAELDLDSLERRAIDAWECADVPPNFVDRVVPEPAANVEVPASGKRFPVVSVAAAGVLGLLAVSVATVAIRNMPVQRQGEVSQAWMTPPDSPRPGATQEEGSGATWPPPVLPEDFPELVDGYIGAYGQHYGPAFRFHGAVVVARDGEVLYARGFGESDLTPVKAGGHGRRNAPDTRFRIGSLTQQFTAVAVLQLHERGRLDLDDRIDVHLPGFESARHGLTIRHLLTHSSGLWNFTDDAVFELTKNQVHPLDDLVEQIDTKGIHFTPGSEFEATNSNYLLLGKIIENVSGQDYAEYVEDNIVRPAGMSRTSFGDAYETGQQARGYAFNEEEFLEPAADIHLPNMGAAAALVSTPEDLVAWDAALYDGRLLTAETTESMYRPVFERYGMGWVVDRAFGRKVVSHPGGVDGFNAHIMRFVDDHTMVLAIANTEVIDCRRVASDVASLVYGEDREPRIEHRSVFMDPGQFPRFEGLYRLTNKTRREYSGRIEPEQLDQLAEVRIVRDGDRMWMRVPGHGSKWMHPLAPERFFFKDDAGTEARFFGDPERAKWLTLERQGREFLLERAEE